MRMSLVVLVAVASACGGGAATVETAAPTTSTVLPTTPTTEPETTTSEPPTTFLDEWESIEAWRGGPAGEYRTTDFAPAFSFTTTAAFGLAGLQCEDATDMVQGSSGVYFFNFGRGSVDETMSSITSLEGVTFGDAEPVEVGGAPGMKVTGEAELQSPVGSTCGGADTFVFETGAELTVYNVDVNGDTVTIIVEKLPGTPPTFDEQAQDSIDSVAWKDLS